MRASTTAHECLHVQRLSRTASRQPAAFCIPHLTHGPRGRLPSKPRPPMPADAETNREASAEADVAAVVEVVTYDGGAAKAEQGSRVTAEQAASAFHNACASSLQRREDAEHPWGHMAEKDDGGLCQLSAVGQLK